MIERRNRVSPQEALTLYYDADFLELLDWADRIRWQIHPEPIVSFVVDRNINYTNVCMSQCKFCAFWRNPDAKDAYTLSYEEVAEKIEEALSLGATSILIQGGLNPKISLPYISQLFSTITSRYDIRIHGLSPPEICFLAQKEGISIASTLQKLKKAGLTSIPGGGAEILSGRVRNMLSPHKCSVEEWLQIMKTAHKMEIRSSATMMFGHVETIEERIQHLHHIRHLQDKTNGFTAFILWPFQPYNTALAHIPACSSIEYLKMLAISRIFLDNIKNIQASWVTQGMKIGQLSLRCGANDLGSLMIEENVVKAAGVSHRTSLDEMIYNIKKAGFIPAKRDTLYTYLEIYP